MLLKITENKWKFLNFPIPKNSWKKKLVQYLINWTNRNEGREQKNKLKLTIKIITRYFLIALCKENCMQFIG